MATNGPAFRRQLQVMNRRVEDDFELIVRYHALMLVNYLMIRITTTKRVDTGALRSSWEPIFVNSRLAQVVSPLVYSPFIETGWPGQDPDRSVTVSLRKLRSLDLDVEALRRSIPAIQGAITRQRARGPQAVN